MKSFDFQMDSENGLFIFCGCPPDALTELFTLPEILANDRRVICIWIFGNYYLICKCEIRYKPVFLYHKVFL